MTADLHENRQAKENSNKDLQVDYPRTSVIYSDTCKDNLTLRRVHDQQAWRVLEKTPPFRHQLSIFIALSEQETPRAPRLTDYYR